MAVAFGDEMGVDMANSVFLGMAGDSGMQGSGCGDCGARCESVGLPLFFLPICGVNLAFAKLTWGAPGVCGTARSGSGARAQ